MGMPHHFPQIAGTRCALCQGAIILHTEGTACPNCSQATAHKTCLPETPFTCPACAKEWKLNDANAANAITITATKCPGCGENNLLKKVSYCPGCSITLTFPSAEAFQAEITRIKMEGRKMAYRAIRLFLASLILLAVGVGSFSLYGWFFGAQFVFGGPVCLLGCFLAARSLKLFAKSWNCLTFK